MPRSKYSRYTNWLHTHCCCRGQADSTENVHRQNDYEEKIYVGPVPVVADGVNSTRLPEEILQLDAKSIEIYKNALSSGKIEDHEVRVMIVGHLGVGKTTLRKRLHGEPVDIHKREPTDGIDVHTRRSVVSLHDGKWRRFDTDNESKAYLERLAKVLTETNIEHSEAIAPVTTIDGTNRQPTSQQDNEDTREEETVHTSADQLGVIFECAEEQSIVAQISGEHDESEKLINSAVQGNESSNTDEHINDIKLSEENTSNEREQQQSVTAQGSSEQFQPRASSKDGRTEISLEELRGAGQEEGNILDELQGVITAADTSTGENSAFVSIWDFAGDSAFYATHQVFLSKRAVYLLVTDMSKHVDDIVYDDNRCFESFGAKSCQVSEFVEFWLNSIHCYCGNSCPNVILVGTHADKLDQIKKESLVKSYFESVRQLLLEKELKAKMIVEDQFAIDNTIPDDAELERLKQKILNVASKQTHWGNDIPARWISLEKAFSIWRERGEKFILRTALSDINQTLPVPLETEDEMDVFLTFQHDLGTILYFRERELRDYILLDPQWMIDAIKCIITAKYFCSKKAGIALLWEKFNTQALLKHKLIEAVWNSKDNINFWKHHKHLLQLMMKLDLIARPCSSEDKSTNTVEDTYFVPCVLKDLPSKDLLMSSEFPTTSHLCYTTTSRYIPTALFNRLLAACTTKWPLYKQANRPCIFCGCGIFQVNDTHHLTVYFRQDFIQLWVTRFATSHVRPDTSVCSAARIFIEGSLKRIFADAKNAGAIQQYIKCPTAPLESLREIIDVTRFHGNEEVPCKFHNELHMLKSKEMLHCWFEGTSATGAGPLSEAVNIMSDNFVRLQTLLVDVCTIPLRALFIQQANKDTECLDATLDIFLAVHQKTIWTVRPLYPAHKKVMYPLDGSKADISRWDITLLCALLLKLFPDLPQQIKDYIKGIKDTRNDCQHIGSTKELDTQRFNETWNVLEKATKGIAVYLTDQSVMKDLDDKINQLQNEPIRTRLDSPKDHALQDVQTGLNEVQSKQDLILKHLVENNTIKSDEWQPVSHIAHEPVAQADASARSVSRVDQVAYPSLKIPEDKYKCRVQGSCPLPDGGFLIADESNVRLKRLNVDARVVAHLDLPGAPWAVCYNPACREAAVSMPYENAIQFVSLDGQGLILSKRIGTHYECKGVACRQDELLWVGQDEGGKLTGVHRCEWKRGTRREEIVPRRRMWGKVEAKWPRHVAVREDGQVVYLACRDNGLLIVGLDGNLLGRVKDLEDTAGVCLGDAQSLFISGVKKGSGHRTVLQCDREGRRLRKIVTHEQLRGKWPWSVSYSRSTLVVTWDSDDVAVFHLK